MIAESVRVHKVLATFENTNEVVFLSLDVVVLVSENLDAAIPQILLGPWKSTIWTKTKPTLLLSFLFSHSHKHHFCFTETEKL